MPQLCAYGWSYLNKSVSNCQKGQAHKAMCLPFWQSALYTSNPMAGVAVKCSIKDGYIISTGIFEPNITEVFLFPAFIKGRVEGIVIFRVKGIQNTAERFAEVSNLSKGHSALEPQGIPVFSSGRKMGRTSPVFLW